MAFQDLREFFENSLTLPVGGKNYVIPGVDAETGLWFQSLLEQGKHAANTDEDAPQLDDEEERDVYRTALGPAYDEMIADGLEWEELKHCGLTAFFWAAGNKITAEKYWLSGGDPEALARTQNRAQRRSSASGSKKRKGGAAGSSSRKAASTSGTKTRASRGARS